MSRRKNGKKKQKPRHRNNHHLYPRSRKKDGDLEKFKPILRSLHLRKLIKPHNAWHDLFLNLFPEESLSLIKKAFKDRGASVAGIISFIKQSFPSYYGQFGAEATKKDLAAWHEIFNNYWSWRKIKKTIRKEWMYPGVKAIISKRKVIGVMIFLKNVPKKARIIENIRRCKDIQIKSATIIDGYRHWKDISKEDLKDLEGGELLKII